MKFINNSNDLATYLNLNILKNVNIKNISVDTRTIKKDSLFIAIKGKNFDGNNFVDQAFKKGAVLAIVDNKKFSNSKNKKIIFVPNTLKALEKISKNIIKNYKGKVIAVTGSNGKTSTTNIISTVLKNSSKTIQNYNNEIGMPLSLINASPDSNHIVMEIGASKIGDINYLSKILNPIIGVITNIGNSHLENLKNIKGVLRVKSEIIGNIKNNGFLVVPNDNKDHLRFWRSYKNNINILTVGFTKDADFSAIKIQNKSNQTHFTISSKFIKKTINIKTPLQGKHNVRNILISFAVYFILEKNEKHFISNLNIKNVRQNKSKWLRGSTLIDDTYNANPDSTKKAIDLLSMYKKNTILILGDMLELGRYRRKFHKEIGIYAKAKGIKKLLCFGELTKETIVSYGKKGIFFDKEKDLKSYLKENISSKDVILIKGSRGMKMERFINV